MTESSHPEKARIGGSSALLIAGSALIVVAFFVYLSSIGQDDSATTIIHASIVVVLSLTCFWFAFIRAMFNAVESRLMAIERLLIDRK